MLAALRSLAGCFILISQVHISSGWLHNLLNTVVKTLNTNQLPHFPKRVTVGINPKDYPSNFTISGSDCAAYYAYSKQVLYVTFFITP